MTNQEVDQSKDMKLSANPSSGKTKLKEKVKLKPKSAQRKLSAPAQMMTPPTPNPIVNGHDMLSKGIILDGRGNGMCFDPNISSIREEDGKPSFAKAAKVVHAKVQVF